MKTSTRRYCCRRHTPPFHVRLAQELRRNWLHMAVPALLSGYVACGLLVLVSLAR